ncbi:hypothetical protein [Azotobacter beijerinckii]|uniref:TIGR02646 family protein n=1 Tax=Azotobacter beijerinckii TaxID=170623 RepID=A0A1I4AE67_9GAMM|nr:hypothetical protein [Azotobacter beijerinckii]SFA93773.1 hypothetical protein SAMN04244571_00842 [Azotobacter beijerinckii]SFK54732.1 hypothetical protein SAMN04244574_00995 [Azotobacter beijerinckii]
MIPVGNPLPEPESFERKCRQKGLAWLAEHPDGKRPRDFWSPFRHDLARGFGERCGYGAMWISSGTVDHFVSCRENRQLAYEWSNYRYIEGWINSAKNKKDSASLLDPFEVQEGWFEIDLPSLQLKLTDSVSPEYRQRAEYTLRNLPIRDDERIMKQRRAWYELYESGELSLEGLRQRAPLIAAAVEKQLAKPKA